MSERVYKKIEIVGSSGESVTAAIEQAVAKASRTLHNLDWFEVSEVRGRIQDGKIADYQVTLKVGFRLD
ncbi:MAG TPA: dodecin [Planctomycetota bacterium]|nr:dodecin [Planctomycetota bacterium]